MNEYKFRGKRIDNGEWVYGDFVNATPNRKMILPQNQFTEDGEIKNPPAIAFEVIAKTVGQYIGMKDKNGNEIYEHDIDCCDTPMIVTYEDGMFGLKYSLEGKYFDPYISWIYTYIRGNVHDNPELLEEGLPEDEDKE